MACTSLSASTLTGTFVGNSHTAMHDLPGTVAELLVAAGKQARFRYEPCSWLDSVANLTFESRPNIVVLQAQRISMSHTRNYSREAAIGLAKRAKQAGAQVYLYAEFPMKGVDESVYIENAYRDIAKGGGGKIVPVGRAWDLAIHNGLTGELWEPDGNHESQRGSALTALVFYYRIAGPDAPTPVVPGRFRLEAASQRIMVSAAKQAIRDEMRRES